MSNTFKEVVVIFIMATLTESVYCQKLFKITSSSFYINQQVSQYPADRGIYPPSSISEAYSYRIGFEGTRPISEKLSLTLGINYTKDYFNSRFDDSLYRTDLGQMVAVKGYSIEDYNLIETPIGLEYKVPLSKKVDLVLNASLIAGWNIGSRDVYMYDDPLRPGPFYRSKRGVRIPIPSSLRMMGGIGVACKIDDAWSLIFQPNYIHGLECIFDMPLSNIYSRFPLRRGSCQFLNLKLGIRRSF